MRLLPACLASAAVIAATAVPATAQDNSALLELLVRKGIVTDQEAEDLRADLAKENTAATVSTAKGSFLDKVTLTGRLQAQFAGLSTDIADTTADPASTSHFFLRRVYVGVKAQLLAGVTGYVNYDFAGSTFDAATLSLALSDTLSFDAGLRKAPFGYDEALISSGSLKSIERSGITRYFVEGNNGRRLGAGSYRQGVWMNLGNPKQGFTGTIAVTNPERDESSTGAAGTGSAANNHFAYWAYSGYNGLFAGGSYKVGAAIGVLPDQGGKTLGAGDDLTVYNAYGDLTIGKFNVAGEFYTSDNENGAGAGLDANSWGYWIQPSYRFGLYEAVFRYGYVDSDGRGVSLSDAVRSAPSGGTMDKLTEIYAGGAWYIRGNDFKLQLGYVWGESKNTVAGAPARATTHGVRSQLQVQF